MSIRSQRISSCSSARNRAPSLPGRIGYPFICHRRVAGADGIDRDEAAALALELADRHLQRIAVMVLRGADHHEQLGALQVRPAELPEAAADGVDHAGRHVHRAEAAMRCVVGRAVVLGEEAGQGLHLVAAGEEREFLRVSRTDRAEPFGHEFEGAFPGDRFEFAGAAWRAGLAQQRLGQPRRRVLLHDPGGSLGADDAFVERMLGIAVDVANLAVAQVHPDAAAAGAHVAGGGLDLGGRAGQRRSQRIVDRGARQELQHGAGIGLRIRFGIR